MCFRLLAGRKMEVTLSCHLVLPVCHRTFFAESSPLHPVEKDVGMVDVLGSAIQNWERPMRKRT